MQRGRHASLTSWCVAVWTFYDVWIFNVQVLLLASYNIPHDTAGWMVGCEVGLFNLGVLLILQ